MNDFKESSTLGRMQERYWTTKQAVLKKLGKKNDDCIVASDAELDAKIELFQTIEESFFTLMRVLENYQDKLCSLAQEENAMGRFLKENGKHDKTRAGKVMNGAGKALSFSAQQKLSLRLPLVRLYHEVETFQYRAIVDTLQTVEKMEKARTAYRGALMWMKDVSQQLDPDTCKQLEKFRKVQGNVRKTKARFDKLKLDTLQKVDLLSFSRCNLFSQALATYQNALIAISEKMNQTMTSVAETTKGYQHYEFSTLKELTETSKKLSEETSNRSEAPILKDEQCLEPMADKDVLLFFDSEYHDDDNEKKSQNTENIDKMTLHTTDKNTSYFQGNLLRKIDDNENTQSVLLNIDNEDTLKNSSILSFSCTAHESKDIQAHDSHKSDLLTGMQDVDVDKSDLQLLNEILDAGCDFSFSDVSELKHLENVSLNHDNDADNVLTDFQNSACFLPSHLLDMSKGCNKTDTENSFTERSGSEISTLEKKSVENKKGQEDKSSWYNLFADLDPLANPDLIGKKPVDEIDC